jgi:hypothetical protein
MLGAMLFAPKVPEVFIKIFFGVCSGPGSSRYGPIPGECIKFELVGLWTMQARKLHPASVQTCGHASDDNPSLKRSADPDRRPGGAKKGPRFAG